MTAMDIHRCRFVPYPPAAINTIAFSHPRPDSKTQSTAARVAIGRENGDIEIWHPRKGNWQQEKIIVGAQDRNVDSLVWITGPDRKVGEQTVLGEMRLFSSGYTGTITEWDIGKGRPRSHATGNHGDVWCMTGWSAGIGGGKDGKKNKGTSKIVVGTAKGELAVYSVVDDELRFDRIVARSATKGTQMVSVAFQSDRVVIVGCSDGTVRAYDILKGSLLRKMTLSADLNGRSSKDIIAWAVKCLPSGDIVSADSSGQIVIWDGRTYTQAQRIQAHDQDALSLACSQDGSVIVSGGMDRRTIIYKKNAGSSRWSKVWGRRYHEHDVKTLATFEIGDTSIVIAGGPDATPVLIPLKEAGMENHRRLPMLPHRPPITSAPSARLIASWWGQEVHIWTLIKSFPELLESDNTRDLGKNWVLLKTIKLKGDANITSAAITNAGDALLVATTSGLKAFNISFAAGSSMPKPSDLVLSTIALPENVASLIAHTVAISPDGTTAALIQGCDTISLLNLHLSDDGTYSIDSTITPLKRIPRDLGKSANSSISRYERSIIHVAFSSDSRILAAADIAGFIDTWVTIDTVPASASTASDDSNDEDETSVTASRWIRNPRGALLPKLAGSPSAISFASYVPSDAHSVFSAPAGIVIADLEDYTLLAVTVNFHVTAFSILRGTLTRWSRRNHRSALPAQMLDTRDVVKGILLSGSRAWLYGISFVFMLDLGQDLENPAAKKAVVSVEESRKRKRSAHDSGAGGKMAKGTLGPISVGKLTTGSSEVTDVFEYDSYRKSEAKMAKEELREEGQESDDEEEDDYEGGEAAELVKRRAAELAAAERDVEESKKGRAFGISFKYRYILGVVPLERADGGVEVALVERPLWEVDLPERYVGANERR